MSGYRFTFFPNSIALAGQDLAWTLATDALFTQVLLGAKDGENEEMLDTDSTPQLGSFARWFLDENLTRIAKAFDLVGGWCDFHRLRYVSIGGI